MSFNDRRAYSSGFQKCIFLLDHYAVKIISLTLAVIYCGAANLLLAGGITSELNSDQLNELRDGHLVFATDEMPPSPWPRVRAYRLINATPEEVVAVFFDYENAPKFIPHLKSAIISKRNSPTCMEVDYVLAVPIISDERYRTRNTLSHNEQGVFKVDWLLLQAMRTKSSVGHMQVEPFEGKALMAYCSMTVPGSSIAFLLKRTALEQVRQTVDAIAKEVETQKSQDPDQLGKEVNKLNSVLISEVSNTSK